MLQNKGDIYIPFFYACYLPLINTITYFKIKEFILKWGIKILIPHIFYNSIYDPHISQSSGLF